jgi:D-alanyl-D-alanine carboxypeptidase/D-alanyl-D-alanine-endopeptidase (penicillin-binding protein 4)
MSTYNRVSPRAAVALLIWGQTKPWGRVWRSSLPIAAVDGTLRRRFGGTALSGKLWAKTGTLNATNALSGYLQAASGQELIFSMFANDVPGDASAAPAIDAALALIAAAN